MAAPDRAGLSSADAAARLRRFGPNRLPDRERRDLPRIAVEVLRQPMFLMLVVTAALYLALGDLGEGLLMSGFALVNLGLVVVQEWRTERVLDALRDLSSPRALVIRDGQEQRIAGRDVVPGDLVILAEGDRVPADALVLACGDLHIDESLLTGESVPVRKVAGTADLPPAPPGGDNLPFAFSGTLVVKGQGLAEVRATGLASEIGKIGARLATLAPEPTLIQTAVARLVRGFAAFGLGTCFLVVLLYVALRGGWLDGILAGLTVAMSMLPEEFPMVLTVFLALGALRLSRQHVLTRRAAAIESLGAASVLCVDKTGTLTQNRMEVKSLFLSGHYYEPAGGSTLPGLLESHRPFFEAAFLCHTLKEVDQRGGPAILGDPMEVALVRMARLYLRAPMAYPRIDEVPFDSDRKRLSVLHQTPQGLILYTKGALEALLPLCSKVKLGGETKPLGEDLRKEFMLAQDTLAAEGLRVLAVAYRGVPADYDRDHLEVDLTLMGLVGLEDPPRPEVPDAVAKCHQAGIKVIMVTGDHPHTARAIARQIGLLQGNSPTIVTGDKLRRMSATQLQLSLDLPDILFARVAADQKVRIVRALKAKGHIVAVTGDGVNDAPALRQAHIGIAMGETGTDVAREAADMVLLDDNFASIVAAVEEGRAVFANIRKFLTYILTSNVPELVPYLAFVLFKIPLALTVIQILVVDLGTDMLPALGLGAEKPEPETMQKPPRSPEERLVDWPLLARSYLFLGLIEAGAAMVAFFFVLRSSGWVYGQVLATGDVLYLQATTACLSAIIVMQVVNVFLCRGERASVFSFAPFSNRLILAGILTELVLISLIDYTALGNRLFATAPLAGKMWLLVIPFAFGMLVLEELRKLLTRRLQRLTS